MPDETSALKEQTAALQEAWQREREQAEAERNAPATVFRWKVPIQGDKASTVWDPNDPRSLIVDQTGKVVGLEGAHLPNTNPSTAPARP